MKKGFTLIELLAVVLMVSILSAIAVPQYRRSVARSRVAEAKQNLPAIYDAAERWRMEHPGETLSSFKMLDVTLKGKINSSSAAYWETPTFKYNYQSSTGANATAEMLMGKYVGTKVHYNGSAYSCTNPSGMSNACSDLGF